MMLHSGRSSLAACILIGAAVLVGGCRTYGGYDSEPAIYAQIQAANERFEEDLQRARAELSALESVPEPIMEPLAARYGWIVQAHEAVLEEHQQLEEKVSAGSSHRALHRLYGAIVVEQSVLRSRYRELLEYVYRAFPADTTAQMEPVERPYALVPPFYNRISAGDRGVTVNEVMRRVRTAPGPVPGFELSMPQEEDEAPGDDGTHGEPAGHDSAEGSHG